MTSTQNFMHYFLEENLWKLSIKFDPWWVAWKIMEMEITQRMKGKYIGGWTMPMGGRVMISEIHQHQLYKSKCQLNPIDTRGTPPSNIPPWKFNITPCKMVGLEDDPFLLGPGNFSVAKCFGRGPGVEIPSTSTPPKFNMEPEIHPLEKEKHLPDPHCWVPC